MLPKLVFVIAAAYALAVPAHAVKLGVSSDRRHFTLDGKPTFLLGISYYGGTSVSDPANLKADLDEIAAAGFNWIRVWATWDPGPNVSVIEPDGSVREPFMSRLKNLIRECDRRRIVVDITMTRGKSPMPSVQKEHLACAHTLARELKPFRNVYFDVGNERGVGDSRHVPLAEVGEIIGAIKAVDSDRLCTASGVPGSSGDLLDYLQTGRCDFIAPHLGRDADLPSQTEATVHKFIDWMTKLGRRAPIHLQEPFRRDYGKFQPTVKDFYTDAIGAKKGGAAGWCLHNGSSRFSPDKRPHRSFLMSESEGRLFKQLDEVEREVCKGVSREIGGTDLKVKP